MKPSTLKKDDKKDLNSTKKPVVNNNVTNTKTSTTNTGLNKKVDTGKMKTNQSKSKIETVKKVEKIDGTEEADDKVEVDLEYSTVNNDNYNTESNTTESNIKEIKEVKEVKEEKILETVKSNLDTLKLTAESDNFKKLMKENKELRDQIIEFTTKLDKEKRLHTEIQRQFDQSIKETELLSNNYQQALNLQKESQNKVNELNLKLSNCNKEISGLKKTLEEKTIKIEELELDNELQKEEFEGLKLEFEEYKIKSVSSRFDNLDGSSPEAKIMELENQVSLLTNALMKVDMEKNKEIVLLKKENERLAEKAKDAEELAQRDEIIALLKETIVSNENSINELKEQLEVFSTASNMIDDIIMEKTQLEDDLAREKAEKSQLKYEMETNDMLIEELDQSNKLSEKMILEKEDEIIRLNNELNSIKADTKKTLKQFEDFNSLITKLKNDNNNLKEELGKNSNLNVDDILYKKNQISSQIKTLNRQTVIPKLTNIDAWVSELKLNLYKQSMPESLFLSNNGLANNDKILLLMSLRRKASHLMEGLIENEIFYDLSKSLENSDQKNEFGEKYYNFILSLLNTLDSYSNNLFTLECYFLNEDLSLSDYNIAMTSNIWTNILGTNQYLVEFINEIRQDTFGIDFSSKLESLNLLVTYIKDDVSIFIKNVKFNYSIITFYSKVKELLIKQINELVKNVSAESKKDHSEKIKELEDSKSLISSYKKMINKLDSLMDYNNTLVVKFKEIVNEEKTDENVQKISNQKFLIYDLKYLNEVFVNKIGSFENLVKIDDIGKIYQQFTSNLDKLEKSLIERDIITSSTNLNLNSSGMLSINPVVTWNIACNEILSNLENISKLKQDLNTYIDSTNSLKKQALALELNLKEMSKTKEINDRKLGEAFHQIGKIAILEMEKEEMTMKISKFENTVDSIMSELLQEQEKTKTLTTQLTSFQNRLKDELKPDSKISMLEGKRTHQRVGLGGNEQSTATRLQNHLNKEDKVSTGYGNATESAQLLNAVIQLHREKKLLKAKLMKEKLEQLQDENSYINKYIKKIDNNKGDLELIADLEEDLNDVNKDFQNCRKRLVTPIIYDITKKDYNYVETKVKQENLVKATRIDYLGKINKVMFNIFGTQAIDKSFKENLDNTIIKNLDYFEQKKLIVGKLSFKTIGDYNLSNTHLKIDKEKDKKVIPIYVNESTLKNFNKTFTY